MSKISVTTHDLETGGQETVDTDGCIIIYLVGDKVKFGGTMSIRSLAPILTKIALEKLTS